MPLQHIRDQQFPQGCREAYSMRKGLVVRSAEAIMYLELALETHS